MLPRVISDTYGRRITLMCTFVVFLSACIGLALTTRLYQLLILRCLQSFGSASTIAIGAGIVGDVTTREERGGFMGVFQTGLLLPLGESSMRPEGMLGIGSNTLDQPSGRSWEGYSPRLWDGERSFGS